MFTLKEVFDATERDQAPEFVVVGELDGERIAATVRFELRAGHCEHPRLVRVLGADYDGLEDPQTVIKGISEADEQAILDAADTAEEPGSYRIHYLSVQDLEAYTCARESFARMWGA